MPQETIDVRVYYDDQPDQVAERFCQALKSRGIRVEEAEGGDGIMVYTVWIGPTSSTE